MIEREKLEPLLRGHSIGSQIVCLEETDSTNLEICRRRAGGAGHGLLVTAEKQNAGKGRRGRTWVSNPEGNLYFSLLLCPSLEVSDASLLTPLMAMAVCAAVRENGVEAGIKWPNDVVDDGRKLCGILTELFLENDGFYVVIGTGINVNQTAFLQELGARATSLYEQAGHFFDRERLLARVLLLFEGYYEKVLKEHSLAGLREEYEAHLLNQNAAVEVLDPKGAWKGVALGIDDGGELLVRREDGRVETVYAGEVSVRGIYGYV